MNSYTSVHGIIRDFVYTELRSTEAAQFNQFKHLSGCPTLTHSSTNVSYAPLLKSQMLLMPVLKILNISWGTTQPELATASCSFWFFLGATDSCKANNNEDSMCEYLCVSGSGCYACPLHHQTPVCELEILHPDIAVASDSRLFSYFPCMWLDNQTVSCCDDCKSNQPIFWSTSVNQTKQDNKAQAPKHSALKAQVEWPTGN